MPGETWKQREAARDAVIARVAPSLSPEIREQIRREVDAAPPLSPEQRHAVAVLLEGYLPVRRPRAAVTTRPFTAREVDHEPR